MRDNSPVDAGRRRVQHLRRHAARIDKGHKLTLPKLIAETHGRVQWIEAQLRIEDDPTRKVKLRKNLEIKSAFLTRLRRELNLGVRS